MRRKLPPQCVDTRMMYVPAAAMLMPCLMPDACGQPSQMCAAVSPARMMPPPDARRASFAAVLR